MRIDGFTRWEAAETWTAGRRSEPQPDAPTRVSVARTAKNDRAFTHRDNRTVDAMLDATPVRWARREIVAAGALGGSIALFFALRLAAHGDASAHLHRTLLVLKGDLLWDNMWFRGDYPLAGYSFLYYLPAALVGNSVVAVCSTFVAVLLFASLVLRQWGGTARWSAWLFAVLAVEPLLRTEYPFALGVTLLLAALFALQRRKVGLAGLCAALCLATSPLAFAFLALAAAGVWLSHPTRTRTVVGFGAILALLTIVFAVISRRLETPWSGYPFPVSALAEILAVSGAGILLTRLAGGPRLLGGLYGVWAAAGIVGWLVPNPIGLNFDRPAFLLTPLLIVPAARLRGRVKVAASLAIVALLPLGAPAFEPSVARALAAPRDPSRLWAQAVAFLGPRVSPDYRVEVVPTASHWEAYYLPKAGIELARGWYRQLDLAANAVLYHRTLSARRYRSWLDANSVQWVVVARTSGLDPAAGSAETKLLASGRSGLRLVRETQSWAFYEVPRATPLLLPQGSGSVTAVTPQQIVGVVRSGGLYRLNVTYMPYWETRGGVVVQRARDGTTLLRIRRSGRFTLTAAPERIFGLG